MPTAKYLATTATPAQSQQGATSQRRHAPAALQPGDRARGLIQTKLEIGDPGDRYEREAESVARSVTRAGAADAIPPTITPLGTSPGTATARWSASEPVPSMPPLQREAPGEVARRAAEDPEPTIAGAAPAALERAITRMQAGAGGSLDRDTRALMEGRFGRDLGGVRVHRGDAAARAAKALHARAFTLGRDVFFGAGEYQPRSHEGRALIAHELTHTVQQANGAGVAAPSRVQRASPTGARMASATRSGEDALASDTTFVSKRLPGAEVNAVPVNGTRGTVTLPVLGLPSIAGALKGTAGEQVTPVAAAGRAVPAVGAPFTLAPVPPRDAGARASEDWTEDARANLASGVRSKLDKIVASAKDIAPVQEGGVPVYYLTFAADRASDRRNLFIGALDELSAQDALLRPQWNQRGATLSGRGKTLDADHFLELQLGGADSPQNMWLLQGRYNSLVGNRIKTNLENDLRRLLKEIAGADTIPDGQKPRDVSEVKRSWTIRFTRVEAGSNFPSETKDFWTRDQIREGAHLQHLMVMGERDLVRAGIRLEDDGARLDTVKVFPSPAGGRMATVRLDEAGRVLGADFLYENVYAEGGQYHGGATDQEGGPLLTLDLVVNKREKKTRAVIGEKRGSVDVLRNPRLGIAGFVSRASIMRRFASMDFTPLSPLTFSDLGISDDGALVGTGQVLSSKALFPNLSVPLTLYGDRVMMNFPVPVAGLSAGPLTVTEADLTLGVAAGGFFVEGYAAFEVTGLGQGSLTAIVDSAGPRLVGTLSPEPEFLGDVTVTYDIANDTLSASASLEIPPNRVPGVDSGTVEVTLDRDRVAVAGSIDLAAPLSGTVLDVGYTPERGLSLAAEDVPLPFSNLPAVQDATMSIAGVRDAESGSWHFSGTGQAKLAAPAVTGTISLSYLDGLVRMQALGSVQKGPARGVLVFNATNGPVDAEGNPVEGPIGRAITAWGRGTVTVAFGPVLHGTAGIELTPENAVILRGEIALPPQYEVFARREYERELLRIKPPEFPIWGVSVAGVGVGIFAFVDASIALNAFVGPGLIRNAAVNAEMDLDHPENATVTGTGEFYVPGYAGLSLDVGGGLSARLAIAYARGRVGLEGRLGAEASTTAAIDIAWNRADGLTLLAELEANARPKFDLLANASVRVGVDLLIRDVSREFGPWERELGSFGPTMELGVGIPVRWSEADGLELSLDDITVRKPQLDARGLMRDVFDRLVS